MAGREREAATRRRHATIRRQLVERSDYVARLVARIDGDRRGELEPTEDEARARAFLEGSAKRAALVEGVRRGETRVVASISGGKDSAAMSLWLTEQGIDHDRVFADTGWEHALTYEYLRGPLAAKLGPITEVRGPRQMEDLVKHKGMFPSRVRRFCTQELKVFPLARWVKARAEELGCEVVNAVGIRAEESAARAKVPEWEWQETFDCEVWRPLLRWTLADVVAIHKRHGLAPNPLYLLGVSRVGCWPCIYAKKEEIRLLAEIDPARVDRIRELERVVGDAQQERERERESRLAKTEASPGRGRPVFSGCGSMARTRARALRSTT